jgi:starch synthase
LYLKKAYQDDPLYNHSRIIYSVYDDEFKDPLEPRFKNKLMMEGIEDEDVSILAKPTFENLTKLALQMSDAAIFGSNEVNKKMADYIKNLNKPVLEYKSEEEYIEAYSEFYDEILKKPVAEN